jgi:hypothetical protein
LEEIFFSANHIGETKWKPTCFAKSIQTQHFLALFQFEKNRDIEDAQGLYYNQQVDFHR